MRRRLIAALAGVAIATLLLYAGPRVFMISDMVRDREETGLQRTANQVAEAVDLRLGADLPIDEQSLAQLVARDDVEVRLVLADGTRVEAGSVGRTARTVQRELAGGGTLEMALAAETIEGRVADALVPVVVFGTLAVAFAIGVAVVLARRLTTPFSRLAEHAERLGFEDEVAPRSGVPEADHLAEALDRSQRRIAELLRSEREFSSNASHQLRTPLAALRLRVEDLTSWHDTTDAQREELEAVLVEADRLADTVTDLLELARSGGIGGWKEIDVGRAVDAAVTRWHEAFAEAGRRIAVTRGPDGIVAASSERTVDHVLDVLLENALRHGRGVVDVTVQDVDSHIAVRVADEGSFDRAMTSKAFERQARSSTSAGSGIGLDLARTLAESAGARLVLVSHEPTVFELALPHHRRPSDG